ncbi:hypothetical protein LTR53_014483 [Teratosphaeriaceae sp. CCFEE 6253]|nr:hypothetical protein LTR53_014483 [Teratosphaeriaceae sp. CCFEE 6253]
MADYGKIPASATLEPKAFTAHIDDEKLEAMKTILKYSPIGPAVYENTAEDQGESVVAGRSRKYGMRRDWLVNAKDHWLNSFDWRKHEDRLNTFPQYTVPITDDQGVTIDVHFMALFSEKPDAIPIGFYHGWPGSFQEFLGIFTLLKDRYSPKDLPYHVIAPSLPGYTYSSGPPLDRDYRVSQAGDVMHKLMLGLGFDAYLAQGGDIGSFIGRYLASKYDACKGMHLNAYMNGPPKDEAKAKQMDEFEASVIPRGQAWRETGMAYGQEHATRPGTIGLVLSSSPLALLAWIGEKFLEWTDDDPPLDQILESVTLYWLTDTFPRCIYPYRELVAKDRPPPSFVDKPSGYSLFPKELVPVPRTWAEGTANIVSYGQHKKGGHFAAMERPADLLADVEEWVPKAWKGGSKL